MQRIQAPGAQVLDELEPAGHGHCFDLGQGAVETLPASVDGIGAAVVITMGVFAFVDCDDCLVPGVPGGNGVQGPDGKGEKPDDNEWLHFLLGAGGGRDS